MSGGEPMSSRSLSLGRPLSCTSSWNIVRPRLIVDKLVQHQIIIAKFQKLKGHVEIAHEGSRGELKLVLLDDVGPVPEHSHRPGVPQPLLRVPIRPLPRTHTHVCVSVQRSLQLLEGSAEGERAGGDKFSLVILTTRREVQIIVQHEDGGG